MVRHSKRPCPLNSKVFPICLACDSASRAGRELEARCGVPLVERAWKNASFLPPRDEIDRSWAVPRSSIPAGETSCAIEEFEAHNGDLPSVGTGGGLGTASKVQMRLPNRKSIIARSSIESFRRLIDP